MVSNRFVPECSVVVFVVFCFSNPCHFENNFSLSVHIFVHFVTTFIISTLAIWVLDGQFVTNFVILYLSASMKFIGHLLVGRLFRFFFFFFFTLVSEIMVVIWSAI